MILMNVEKDGKRFEKFDMRAKEKKDDSNAPYLGYRSLVLPFREPQGSGLPDRENSAHKFVRPSSSSLNFTIVNTRKPHLRKGYHVATAGEMIQLNKYADSLVKIAKFYEQTLSNGKIFYVYKKDGKVESLPVKYGKNNFSHLTGLIFDRRSAHQMLQDVSQGRLEQNVILVKNDHSTFEKLDVIERLANIISSDNKVLSDLLQKNKQAKKLNFNAAVKSADNSYLLAYRYFDPEVLGPVALINLKNTRNGYSDYSKVPNNKILAVLSETKMKWAA